MESVSSRTNCRPILTTSQRVCPVDKINSSASLTLKGRGTYCWIFGSRHSPLAPADYFRRQRPALDGADTFPLREAFNKIFHANDFRPVYDRVNREDLLSRISLHSNLTGEIELRVRSGGRYGPRRSGHRTFLRPSSPGLAFEPVFASRVDSRSPPSSDTSVEQT